MGFTHYPKLDLNLIGCWVYPEPQKQENPFAAFPWQDLNHYKNQLKPGEASAFWHNANNFTRFFGSIFCDQKLEVTFSFSNDECADDGAFVTEENIKGLNYDAEAAKLIYDPAKQAATGKFLVTIYGRWLRVEVKNVGDAPVEKLRVFVRGSVF